MSEDVVAAIWHVANFGISQSSAPRVRGCRHPSFQTHDAGCSLQSSSHPREAAMRAGGYGKGVCKMKGRRRVKGLQELGRKDGCQPLVGPKVGLNPKPWWTSHVNRRCHANKVGVSFYGKMNSRSSLPQVRVWPASLKILSLLPRQVGKKNTVLVTVWLLPMAMHGFELEGDEAADLE